MFGGLIHRVMCARQVRPPNEESHPYIIDQNYVISIHDNVLCPWYVQLPEGGVVPESYYLKSAIENIDMSQYTTATVGAGGSLEIEVDVDKPNSVLR